VGRNSPNFAPHEKRKNFAGAKFNFLPRNRASATSDVGGRPHQTKMLKTPWGSFEHLR
jgi:hypothetical protein